MKRLEILRYANVKVVMNIHDIIKLDMHTFCIFWKLNILKRGIVKEMTQGKKDKI